MAGKNGGARPGAGRPKGSFAITTAELKKALEAGLGYPYEQMLAEMQVKLFLDFRNDINVKECITFTENITKRLVKALETEITVTQPFEEMSNSDIQERINNLMTKQAFLQPVVETLDADKPEE